MTALCGTSPLSGDERDTVLRDLWAGSAPAEAAALIGRTAVQLACQARTDGELRLALDGAPPEAQRVARMGDYLAALTRHGGIVQRAATEIGVTNRLTGWRSDPHFAAAETAVRTLAGTPTTGPRRKLTEQHLDRAAEALEQGSSIYEAARTVGCTRDALRKAAARHPRLAAALPPVRHQRKSRGGKATAESDGRLRKMWGDPSLTTEDIADHLGVARVTVRKWAQRLGLPGPRAVALTRQHQRDQYAREEPAAHE